MAMQLLQACVVICLVMVVSSATAFVYTPTLHRSHHRLELQGASSMPRGRQSVNMAAAPAEGAHGMRARFLPVEQLDDETFAPRIVQVAGALSDITVADIMAVGCTPPPEMGMWQYDFSDPSGPQMGTVAVPGSEVVNKMVEPVAIVTPNEDLNIALPEGETIELLAIVDRANREFELGKFFLWQTPESTLQVRYFEGSPYPGYECIGRVGLVMIPYLPSMRPKFTGFEEEEY